MTVSSAQYTTNSYRITILNEVTYSNILSAVNQAITTLGWTQYDYVAQSAPGLGSTSNKSPLYTYVYRALNYDGVTYKYCIVRWDIIKMVFYTSTCESWNTTTHIATNESWSQAGAFAQHYDIKDCYIFVAATTRHLVIWPFIKNEPEMWSGVFEFERVAQEDTVATNTPCWAWTNSLMIGSQFGKSSGTSKTMYAFPRTFDGFTGAGAAQVYAPVTNRGMFPPTYLGATVSITDNQSLHLASFYNGTYGWDLSAYSAAKVYSSPIAVDSLTKFMPFGRTFNLSVTGSIGGPFDTIALPLDATGGWISSSGANADCIILPMNGGADSGAVTYGSGKMNSPVGSSALTSNPSKVLAIGDNVWACNLQGIYYWPMSNGTVAPTIAWANPYASNTSSVIDMVFDGERTIYASTYFGLVKIDTETLTATSLVVPNTAGSGLLVTTTVTSGVITGASIGSSAGSGYLAGLNGTLYFSISTAGNYALLSVSVTSGVPSGVISVVYGGTGYTAATDSSTLATMGSGYINIDAKYVYCTSRQIMLKPTVSMIDRTTYTITAMHTSNTTLTLAAAWGTPIPDYNGNCYVASQHGYSASGQSQRLSSFVSDSGSVLYDVANLLNTTTSTTPYFPTSFYIDPLSGTIYCAINNSNSGTLYRLSQALVSQTSVSYTSASTTSASAYRVEAAADYLGDLGIIPFRGIFHIFPKGRAGVTTHSSRLLFSDPSNGFGNPSYFVILTNNINSYIMGTNAGSIHTTGTRVIFSQTALYYANNAYPMSNFQGYTSSRLILKG